MEIPGFEDVSEVLKSGVYALVYQGKVVYIGQSKSMIVRVTTHRSNYRRKIPSWMPPSCKGIHFDEVHIRPCHVDRLDELEYEMINLYKPVHNDRLKHNGKSRAPVTFVINGIPITLNGPRPPSPGPKLERRI